MKKNIILSLIVLLIVVGLLLVIFKNTFNKQPVELNRQEEVKIKIQANTEELTTDYILDKLDEQVEILKPEMILEQESEIIENTKLTNISGIINVANEGRNIQCVQKDILSELDSLISDNDEENSQPCNPMTHEAIQTNEIEIKPQPKIISVEKLEKFISDEVEIISEINISEPKDIVGNERYSTLTNGNISDEGEYIFDYQPQQEWFIPNGNIDKFSLTQSGVIHAYGKNYKHLHITLHKIELENNRLIFEDIVGLLHKYTDKQIYFLNDDQEGNLFWDIHIDFEGISESQELLQKLSQDKYVFSIEHHDEIMPIFLKDKENIENLKIQSESNILQELEKGINHIPTDEYEEYSEQNNQPIIISQPDFQPHEYFRNSPDEAPQVYRYEPKSEWLIPKGNPEEFHLNSSKGLTHAYGTNFKFIAFSLKNEYIETEIGMLEGMTKFLKQFISQDFYFVEGNEEESGYRTIHVNVSSYSESQELMKNLRFDPKVGTVRNRTYLLPEFQHMEKEINKKHDEYSIMTIDEFIE